jgi:hypothetical protein
LGDRIKRIALDILEHLIEANYRRERSQHLRDSNTGLEKLRHLFRLSVGFRDLDKRAYDFALRAIDDIRRQAGGWLRSTDGQAEILFAGIANFQALFAAAKHADKGKRRTPDDAVRN